MIGWVEIDGEWLLRAGAFRGGVYQETPSALWTATLGYQAYPLTKDKFNDVGRAKRWVEDEIANISAKALLAVLACKQMREQ